jgi:hypothetical protein
VSALPHHQYQEVEYYDDAAQSDPQHTDDPQEGCDDPVREPLRPRCAERAVKAHPSQPQKPDAGEDRKDAAGYGKSFYQFEHAFRLTVRRSGAGHWSCVELDKNRPRRPLPPQRRSVPLLFIS